MAHRPPLPLPRRRSTRRRSSGCVRSPPTPTRSPARGVLPRQRHALLAQLADAAGAGDVDGLRRHAHTLKSNAASFGATDLAERARALEAQARAGDVDGSEAQIAGIARRPSTAPPALDPAREDDRRLPAVPRPHRARRRRRPAEPIDARRCRSGGTDTRWSKPATGARPIAVLDEQRVDLVLTDIEMPEMDGYGLLEHRAGDERLRAIPFIVISGVEEMDSIIACIKLGAEDYLPKPFDPVLLHARLGACLDSKRMTDELQRAERAPRGAGRREGARGRAAQQAATLRQPAARRGDRLRRRGHPRQPPSRDHRALLRPAAASRRSRRPPSPRR